jgi:hypothetical protein
VVVAVVLVAQRQGLVALEAVALVAPFTSSV